MKNLDDLTRGEIQEALDAINKLSIFEYQQRSIRGYGCFKYEELPVPGLMKLCEMLEERTKLPAVPDKLVHGSPLLVESLDLTGMGLYVEHQKDPNAPIDDYFDSGCTSFDETLFKRKSELGIKWQVFDDRDIKLQKDLVKK